MHITDFSTAIPEGVIDDSHKNIKNSSAFIKLLEDQEIMLGENTISKNSTDVFLQEQLNPILLPVVVIILIIITVLILVRCLSSSNDTSTEDCTTCWQYRLSDNGRYTHRRSDGRRNRNRFKDNHFNPYPGPPELSDPSKRYIGTSKLPHYRRPPVTIVTKGEDGEWKTIIDHNQLSIDSQLAAQKRNEDGDGNIHNGIQSFKSHIDQSRKRTEQREYECALLLDSNTSLAPPYKSNEDLSQKFNFYNHFGIDQNVGIISTCVSKVATIQNMFKNHEESENVDDIIIENENVDNITVVTSSEPKYCSEKSSKIESKCVKSSGKSSSSDNIKVCCDDFYSNNFGENNINLTQIIIPTAYVSYTACTCKRINCPKNQRRRCISSGNSPIGNKMINTSNTDLLYGQCSSKVVDKSCQTGKNER